MDAINRWHLRNGEKNHARILMDEALTLVDRLNTVNSPNSPKVNRIYEKAMARWLRRMNTYERILDRWY